MPRKTLPVGLDISDRGVYAVVLTRGAKSLDVIAAGRITNVSDLASAGIKETRAIVMVGEERAHVAHLPHAGVIPPSSRTAAATLYAQQLLPTNRDVGRTSRLAGEGDEATIIAIDRARVDAAVAAATERGFRVVAVDATPLALLRTLRFSHDPTTNGEIHDGILDVERRYLALLTPKGAFGQVVGVSDEPLKAAPLAQVLKNAVANRDFHGRRLALVGNGASAILGELRAALPQYGFDLLTIDGRVAPPWSTAFGLATWSNVA
jgi:hypothetical protein